MTYHRVYSTTSAVCGAGTSYPKVVPVFTHGIRGVSVERTLVFCTIFCRSLFVLSHLDIELIVVRFTDSGYHFGIFKLFLNLVCPFMDFYTSNACHYQSRNCSPFQTPPSSPRVFSSLFSVQCFVDHCLFCRFYFLSLSIVFTVLLVLVKLGSMAIKKATCPLCCVNSSDILLHLIISCHALLTERNELHYKIVDVLPVQTSVDIFNLEESDILLVMLGSVDQDIIQELSPDLWSMMMFYIAKFMYPLYKKIQPILIENKFNLNY